MEIRNIHQVPVFMTKDGSEIHELLAHRNSSIRNQSLAAARLAPGCLHSIHNIWKADVPFSLLLCPGL